MKKLHPTVIALLQTLAIIFYTALISGFFFLMNRANYQIHEFWTVIIVLLVLVFSAAICGLIVFGYPIYFVINAKIKKALSVLGYNFLFLFIAIVISIIVIAIIYAIA